MAKQIFSGDDDEKVPEKEKKQKLNLSKYSAGQDVNSRNLFWSIMGSYASNGKPGLELSSLEMNRFALIRVAIRALDRPSPIHARLTAKYIARYSLMMILDAGWKDVFAEFLEKCGPRNKGVVLSAMKKLAKVRYSRRMIKFLRAMLRLHEESRTALRYLAELGLVDVISKLKIELLRLSMMDIGDNQMNALAAVSRLKVKDEDVVATMILLLSHRDDPARLIAAQVLIETKNKSVKDAKIIKRMLGSEYIKKRFSKESNPEIRDLLEKIAE